MLQDKPVRVAAMFASMNAALLVGFGRWLSGRRNAAWQRTPREAELTPAGVDDRETAGAAGRASEHARQAASR